MSSMETNQDSRVPLIGSPKQILWASKIRHCSCAPGGVLRSLASRSVSVRPTADTARQMAAMLPRECRWWIDHRGNGGVCRSAAVEWLSRFAADDPAIMWMTGDADTPPFIVDASDFMAPSRLWDLGEDEVTGHITLECIGKDGYDAMNFFDRLLSSVGWPIESHDPDPPSVAVVVGRRSESELEKHYIHGQYNYRAANSTGSRGVTKTFVLGPNRLYEVHARESWSRGRRYCVAIRLDGSLYELSSEEASEWIENLPSASMF